MATQFSMLQLFNAALLSQGQTEILADNDGSLEWRLLSRNWPMILEAELEDGNYDFTKQQVELLTRSNGKFGYPDAYLIPLDALHVRRLWLDEADGTRLEPDWVQDATHVHLTSETGCWIEYIICAEPDLWRPNFARGIQMKLEAVILRAMKEEHSEAADMERMAEMYFQRARTRSSQGRSAMEPYKEGRFVSARFGRGAR